MTSSRSRIAREWCLRRFWSGYAYKRHALVSRGKISVHDDLLLCRVPGEGGVSFARAFRISLAGLGVEVGHRQGLVVDPLDVGGEALRFGGGGAQVLALVEEHDVVRAGSGCAVDRQ